MTFPIVRHTTTIHYEYSFRTMDGDIVTRMVDHRNLDGKLTPDEAKEYCRQYMTDYCKKAFVAGQMKLTYKGYRY